MDSIKKMVIVAGGALLLLFAFFWMTSTLSGMTGHSITASVIGSEPQVIDTVKITEIDEVNKTNETEDEDGTQDNRRRG
ncbi:hypothetical protein HOA55_02605 [archaeon]|jgi:hypothetical protein|nr:hypothetical protein [archaeon]MBT3577210.1 hypothetical protein [archaeon]MBT6820219.1 hypothetical protein [archaeon]MBT6956750.1 hypothetical protein [archaeon]MBT7025423.1 hypothetical protein [archaeon]